MNTYLKKLLNIFIHFYEKNKNDKYFKTLLLLASKIFFVIYKSRLLLYKLKVFKTHKLPAYVVSIGNITSGGTGKTPVAIEFAKYFLLKGYKVAVLSRGYKRKVLKGEGSLLVSDGSDIVAIQEQAGDEPYLIAKKVPKALVIVDKDRVKAGLAAIRLGAQVLILDDGFQYLRLERDENILLIDSSSNIENDNLLPLGRLRELPDSTQRASAIVFSNANSKKSSTTEDPRIKYFTRGKPKAYISYKIAEFISLNTKRILSVSEIKGLKALVCCGIANPKSFTDLLSTYDIDISFTKIYPDHYDYKYPDIEDLIKIAKKYNLEDVIITEKDAVKIEDICQAAPLNFWAAKLEIIWDTNIENLLVSKRRQ